MTSLCQKSVAMALVLVAVAAGANAAQADDNYYAMVAVENPTSSPIHYTIKWGEDGEWRSFTVQPGDVNWHSWAYDFANQNRSPRPYVRVDTDLSDVKDLTTYKLEAYAAPRKEVKFAKKYEFRTINRGRNLELYATN